MAVGFTLVQRLQPTQNRENTFQLLVQIFQDKYIKGIESVIVLIKICGSLISKTIAKANFQ